MMVGAIASRLQNSARVFLPRKASKTLRIISYAGQVREEGPAEELLKRGNPNAT